MPIITIKPNFNIYAALERSGYYQSKEWLDMKAQAAPLFKDCAEIFKSWGLYGSK